MKGLTLNINNMTVSGAVNNGCTNVMISNKGGGFRINFGSIDYKGIDTVWYSKNLNFGDFFTIEYGDIDEASIVDNPCKIINVDDIDKFVLEFYNRLKQELISEGLL